MPPQIAQVSVECSSILKRHFQKDFLWNCDINSIERWDRMGSVDSNFTSKETTAGFGQGILRQGWQRAFRPWPQCPSSASKWAKCNLAAEGVCKFAPVLRYLWKGLDLTRSTLHPTFGSCWFPMFRISTATGRLLAIRLSTYLENLLTSANSWWRATSKACTHKMLLGCLRKSHQWYASINFGFLCASLLD